MDDKKLLKFMRLIIKDDDVFNDLILGFRNENSRGYCPHDFKLEDDIEICNNSNSDCVTCWFNSFRK